MPIYINLNRSFIERETYNPDELIASEFSGRRLQWSDVLASQVSVIVAPANHGKTTEMQEQAKRLRADGKNAVYVALRGMADRGSLEKALEATERAAYEAWKAAPAGQLTLFVDSLDEAAAGQRDGIEYSVADMAQELSWPNESVHWVISTRPAVLTAGILNRLNRILVEPLPSEMIVSPATSVTLPSAEHAERTALTTTSSKAGKLRIFSLAPLSSKQAGAYLRCAHPTVVAPQLLQAASERGLSGFTANPGGLDILAAIDLLGAPPESLTEVFNRVVQAVQALRMRDGRLDDVGVGDSSMLTSAVQRLAAASQICQLANIELPESTLKVSDNALSARLIATPMLTERALSQLLNSHLFNDVGYHQVKLYPDELVPFLAAQWIASLVQGPEQARKLVEHFTWSAPTGETGVYREYLPLVGWLATLNSHCREEVLKVEPQALAFFGDLRNTAVPPAAAREALEQSIRRMVDRGDRLGRGMFTLTSENYWQAGHPKLLPFIQKLFDTFGSHYWARDALMDIATASRSDVLRGRVLRSHGGSYARVLEHTIDVRYLLEVGNPDDHAGIAGALKASDKASESLLATLLERLGWNYFSPKEVSDLIARQFARGRGGFHIGYTLESGEFLDASTDAQLYRLSQGLTVQVSRIRRRRRSPGARYSHGDGRLVEIAIKLLASLIQRNTRDVASLRQAKLILVIKRALDEDYVATPDTLVLREALEANALVRQELLRLVVRRAGSNEGRLRAAVYATSVCNFSEGDVVGLGDALLDEVTAKEAERRARAPTVKAPPNEATRENRLKIGEGVKRQLQGMLAALRNGSAGNGLAWVADWLARTNKNSRYGEVDFGAFEREAGSDIANAVREGFHRIWRERPPQFDENSPNSTYHITIAGLQGLHLELGDGDALPVLSPDEARQALRYAVFEINGYPKWFWKLVAAHQSVAINEFVAMVGRAGHGPASHRHVEELLTHLDEAPEPMTQSLAPLAWRFLLKMQPSGAYAVGKLLRAATVVPNAIPQREFEQNALARMKAAFKSPLPETADSSLEEIRQLAVSWAARWLIAYPTSFRKSVIKWGPTDESGVREFIFYLAAHFGRDNSAPLFRLARESDDGVETLELLYLWAMWAIRPENDPQRPDGEVYTPRAHDWAAEMRDILIEAIASAHTQAAYDVIGRLRAKATGTRQMYLQKVQFEMREAEAARAPVRQLDYDRFEEDFHGRISSYTAFAMATHADLLAVKYDIERGEHSLRRFFSAVAYEPVNRKGPDGDRAALALEADFQRLLASELNHHAKGRYSVSVESHTGESKRRDVLCSKDDWRASIELKMSMRWTLDQYVEALEKQLVGQYMRHRKATVGFLVLVLQEKDRTWKDPASGKRLDFEEVLTILQDRARQLSAADRTRYLRVIGIDATTPDDFREEQKRSPKARASKVKRARR